MDLRNNTYILPTALLLSSRCAMALAVEFDGLRGLMGFGVQDIGGLFVDIALLSFCSLFPSMATNNGRFAATAPRNRQVNSQPHW
jgi:hypothetical protein